MKVNKILDFLELKLPEVYITNISDFEQRIPEVSKRRKEWGDDKHPGFMLVKHISLILEMN